jgi:hypothetical protein
MYIPAVYITSFLPTAVCQRECALQPVNYEPMLTVWFSNLHFYAKRHSDFLAEMSSLLAYTGTNSGFEFEEMVSSTADIT